MLTADVCALYTTQFVAEMKSSTFLPVSQDVHHIFLTTWKRYFMLPKIVVMVCSGFLQNAFYIENILPLVWLEITEFLSLSGSYYKKNWCGLETCLK